MLKTTKTQCEWNFEKYNQIKFWVDFWGRRFWWRFFSRAHLGFLTRCTTLLGHDTGSYMSKSSRTNAKNIITEQRNLVDSTLHPINAVAVCQVHLIHARGRQTISSRNQIPIQSSIPLGQVNWLMTCLPDWD